MKKTRIRRHFQEKMCIRDRFWVAKANSIKSKLFSPSDIQSIMKKAIVERLKTKYHVSWFEESGAQYPIRVAFMKDEAVIGIDTSGISLHKRGYRKWTAKAPITETLASALILLDVYKRQDKAGNIDYKI